VLPKTTEQVSEVLRFCHRHGVKVVARGAGTSLAGGAIPQEDAIVLGRRQDEPRARRRFRGPHHAGRGRITNLAVTGAVAAEAFSTPPDPSSQLACTIAGNIAMNSGGAHCLKYGVTTNNVLGVKMVLMDGEIVEIGGAAPDSPGLDLLGIVVGSEGQLGIVTEATLRILPAAEGARPGAVRLRLERGGRRRGRGRSSGPASSRSRWSSWTSPRIEICEAYAHAATRFDVEALLIIEVEGSDEESDATLARIVEIATAHGVKTIARANPPGDGGDLEGPEIGLRGDRAHRRLYLHGRTSRPGSALVLRRWRRSRPATAAGRQRLPRRRRQPASLILYNCNDPVEQQKAEEAGQRDPELCVDVGGCLTGRARVGIEKRDLMLHQFNQTDLDQQMRVRAVFDPAGCLNSGKVFPLANRPAA
jgi:glycolate oxidase